MRLKFDPVAKLPECPDHSDRAHSLRLFAHRRAALLITNAFIQNHPDQLTETMRNRPDGFVVAETRNETTVDDLEDASFTFDGSIGGLIEKATHVPVPLRRARAVIHSRALFLSRACPYPRGEILGGGEGRCLGTHLGNDLLRRIHPETGDSANRWTASWCWWSRLAICWSSWPICCSINCNSSSAIFTSRR